MGKKKVKVKYNAPGWEDRIGTIYSISGDKVTIEFGKHLFKGSCTGHGVQVPYIPRKKTINNN